MATVIAYGTNKQAYFDLHGWTDSDEYRTPGPA
jgi:hypothetical protein